MAYAGAGLFTYPLIPPGYFYKLGIYYQLMLLI